MKMLSVVSALALAASSTAALAQTKTAVVLVHGAWETAGVWGQVEAGLKKDGYRVRTVSLPGRPGNPAAPDKVNLELYQKAVSAVVNQEKGKVVLVGHSFAGFPISAEAEAEPSKIKTLVYVAAYLPQDGQSLLGLATTDAGSKVGPLLKIDKEHGIAQIAYAGRGGLFANDAPSEVGEMVAKAIVDEPLGPLAEPVHLTAARFGSVDKVYVHTARDQVVSPGLQAQMVKATPVRLETSIDSGHTPFITHPAELVAAIERVAG
ncbi:alpha/beta fold hydrolase [Sphingomonas glacialis]|uniref:Alpha/beta fold hydrolase n=1 Tax=Sphingomonas glacialis TaxID=658225 RepID=A0A502FR52_9SPHN|nr:alpha/beta fold hydrolase [Sphingomonas glacialis]TPG52037.1 alpha/beta fold hydrolase [Sphingomonas glacialis]